MGVWRAAPKRQNRLLRVPLPGLMLGQRTVMRSVPQPAIHRTYAFLTGITSMLRPPKRSCGVMERDFPAIFGRRPDARDRIIDSEVGRPWKGRAKIP